MARFTTFTAKAATIGATVKRRTTDERATTTKKERTQEGKNIEETMESKDSVGVMPVQEALSGIVVNCLDAKGDKG